VSDPFPAADLTPLIDAGGDGVHWTLSEPSQLNVNLVRLDPGSTVADHTNAEVDVVLVVLAGTGTLSVDGEATVLRPQVVAHIGRGRTRRIEAGTGDPGLSYLTVHVRRGPLQVAAPVGQCDEGGESPCFAHLLDDDEAMPDPHR
jgi:quercetin dioxygenase-like cupin family protein